MNNWVAECILGNLIMKVVQMREHVIGDYVYDPSRLIFYKKSLDEGTVSRIKTVIPQDNSDETVDNLLLSLDSYDVEYKTLFVTRAGICLTYNCNLRCAYCSDSSQEGNKDLTLGDVDVFLSEIMKRWTVRRLLDGDKAEKTLVIFISGGGEPTYNFTLFTDVIHLISEKANRNHVPIEISITTNGVYGMRERDFIVRNCDKIMVSYDGLPELQDKNRRTAKNKGTNDVVTDTIRYFIANSKNPVTIRTTLWYEDVHLLEKMAEYVFSNFKENIVWNIFPVNPFGRALNRIKNGGDLYKFDFAEAYINVVNFVKKKYPKGIIETSFFDMTTKAFFCGGLSQSVRTPWLLPDKTIVSCMENCGRSVFAEIKEGKFMMKGLTTDCLLAMTQKKLIDCRDCLVFRFCKGGCPAQHISNEANNISGLPWSCEMFESIIKGVDFGGWKGVSVPILGLQLGDVIKLIRKETVNEFYC